MGDAAQQDKDGKPFRFWSLHTVPRGLSRPWSGAGCAPKVGDFVAIRGDYVMLLDGVSSASREACGAGAEKIFYMPYCIINC